MTTMSFDKLPSEIEGLTVNDVQKDTMKDAWKDYQAKPEYKDFNKHDLIESMVDQQDKK